MLTTAEMAVRVNLSRTSILAYIRQGIITAKKHGRDYVIEESEIARFNATRIRPGQRRNFVQRAGPPIERTCTHCGQVFRCWRYEGNRRFCSRPCADAGKRAAFTDRFWAKVQCGPADACWQWQGNRNPLGYGLIARPGGRGGADRAHRIAYELTHGPIPADMVICHRCDNPPCCNPAHLFLGTRADNNADKAVKGRQPRGAAHHGAKLQDADVLHIRSLFDSGVCTISDLARQFDMSVGNMSSIVRRRSWRHL